VAAQINGNRASILAQVFELPRPVAGVSGQ
jgi:hypothetical protein